MGIIALELNRRIGEMNQSTESVNVKHFPMKKSKVKQISYRTLVKQHEALKQQYTQKLDAISSLNNRISELCQGLREARGDLKVREQLDNRRIKAIGLYFAAVDSETSSVPESRDYLRHLRSEIFL